MPSIVEEPPDRALSIRDPFAQAILYGDKRVENRSWKPPKAYRDGGRVAIHVSQTFGPEERAAVKRLEKSGLYVWNRGRFHPGCIIGGATIDEVTGSSDDPWWDDETEWGWVLRDIVPYVPVRVSGFLRLWTIPEEIQKQLQERDI